MTKNDPLRRCLVEESDFPSRNTALSAHAAAFAVLTACDHPLAEDGLHITDGQAPIGNTKMEQNRGRCDRQMAQTLRDASLKLWVRVVSWLGANCLKSSVKS